jgi:gas vesicle protein
MKNNEKLGSFLLGVFVGSVVGSIAALLFAPSSGKDLRKKIKDRAEELVDDAQEIYQTGKEKTGELIDEGRKKANAFVQEAKKIVSN